MSAILAAALIAGHTVSRIDELAAASNDSRNDTAGTGLFFAEELEHRLAEELRKPLPEMSGYRLFPVDGSLPSGAKSFRYNIMESAGRAIRIANPADDLPTVSLERRKFSRPVAPYGIAADWSVLDVMHARFAGVSIESDTMREAIDEAMRRSHEVIWKGDPTVGEDGIWGIYNNPYIPRQILSTRISSAMTPESILTALNGFINQFQRRTKGRVAGRVLTLLVDTDVYSHIASTPLSMDNNTTILSFLLDNNPFLAAVEGVYECSNEYTGTGDHMIVYQNNPTKLRVMTSGAPTTLPAQLKNLAILVPTFVHAAGVHVPYPLEMCIAEMPDA